MFEHDLKRTSVLLCTSIVSKGSSNPPSVAGGTITYELEGCKHNCVILTGPCDEYFPVIRTLRLKPARPASAAGFTLLPRHDCI